MPVQGAAVMASFAGVHEGCGRPFWEHSHALVHGDGVRQPKVAEYVICPQGVVPGQGCEPGLPEDPDRVPPSHNPAPSLATDSDA